MSDPKFTCYGIVVEGKINFDNKQYLKDAVSFYEGKEIQMVLQRKRDTRTTSQNSLLWLHFTILGNELGMTPQEVHDIVCRKFLSGEKVHEASGLILPYTRGTSKLNTKEMTELIEQMGIFFSTEFGIELPNPSQIHQP